MAVLPSSPFISAAIVERPAEAPAVASSWSPATDDAAAECSIGEIFVGARKLEQLPGIFDPVGITPADELLYVTLKLSDDPNERDLPDVPQALIDELEPMPLFLRQAV